MPASLYRALLNADVEKMDGIIALNISALTHLTYAVALHLPRGRGHDHQHRLGRGHLAETLNGVYGASKAYVLALSHSLQHELGQRASEYRPCCQARPRPRSG